MTDTPDIPERVDFWLIEWARSMRASTGHELGFPDHCMPFISGGESQRTVDWDRDEWEKTLARNCAAMDALIASLPPAQALAIRHVYGGDCYRFPRNNLFQLLESAAATLLIGMNARGVI